MTSRASGDRAVPELPEVETIRRGVEKEFAGKRIKQVTVSGARTVRRHVTPADFASRLEGRRLVAVQRRGKYLLLRLDDKDVVVVHLGMSGQLLRVAPRDPLDKHTHVVVSFAGAPQLRFVDPRTFGEMFISSADELDDQVPELAHLGFDPLEDHLSWVALGDLMRAKATKLKPLLMDQRFVAGIGNIYSDEILWEAGLRHDRGSDTLSGQEVRRLYRSMVEVLSEAVAERGSSLADAQYRDLYGQMGDYQHRHKVYDKEGEPCQRCRTPIVKAKAYGRSTYGCPRCQV